MGEGICEECRRLTLFACSDCRIDTGRTVWVCERRECRDAHGEKCPGRKHQV